MENISIYLFTRGQGFRKYNLNAGPLNVNANGELGVIVQKLPENMENVVVFSAEIPFNRYDTQLRADVNSTLAAIMHATVKVEEAAQTLLRRVSSDPSGKYLFRLNRNAWHILEDILRRMSLIGDCKHKLLKNVYNSNAISPVFQWEYLLVSVPTKQGLVCLAINPLSTVWANYCGCAKELRESHGDCVGHTFVQGHFMVPSNDPRYAARWISSFRYLSWVEDAERPGYLVAIHEVPTKKMPAFRKQVGKSQETGERVIRTQELRWVTVQETPLEDTQDLSVSGQENTVVFMNLN